MTALASSINVISDRSTLVHERTIGELFNWSRQWSVRQLWLQPEIIANLGLPAELPRQGIERHNFLTDLDSLSHSSTQRGLMPWMTIWDDSHFLEIAIPQWDRGSPWHGITNGIELGESVRLFTAATGMLWKRSGAITSDAWLRDHYRRGGVLRPTEHPDIALGNVEPDLSFVSPPNGKRPARFCHAFDANAMYLGAASSIKLPTGEASHYSGEETETALPWAVPGYWRYADKWVTTPTAMYRNDPINEMYRWEESHRFLEPWYKVLRDARTTLLADGGPALEAVKMVYRQGIGRLGSTRRASPVGDRLYQPYWRHAVQATARCNLLRAIDKMKVKPVAIDVDCLFFMTGTEDPMKFAQRAGIPVGTKIGQYKIKGTMAGREASQLLRAKPIDAIHSLRRGVAA